MGTTLDRKPVQSVFHLRSVVDDPSALDAGSFAEKHYRIGELAERWGLGRETVRKLVKNEPGVIQIRQGEKEGAYNLHHSGIRRTKNPHQVVAPRLKYDTGSNGERGNSEMFAVY